MKPRILWSVYFDVVLPSLISHSLPENIRIVPNVDEQLNYAKIVCEVTSFLTSEKLSMFENCP